jgi:hypothetical protein
MPLRHEDTKKHKELIFNELALVAIQVLFRVDSNVEMLKNTKLKTAIWQKKIFLSMMR